MQELDLINVEGQQSVIERINNYLSMPGNSKAGLAREISYSRTTLSRYLSGNYDGDTTEIEERIRKFFDKEPIVNSEQIRSKGNPRFFESNDSRAIIGVCEASQEYIGMGIVVGRSGFGKTYGLKHYAKLPRVAYIECDDTMGCRDLVKAIECELRIPPSSGSIWERVNSIKDYCNINKGYLIIVDEADKLISKNTTKKMEILRAIFDQSDVGMVLAGEIKLEVQIKSYSERMANRIDFYAKLGGLDTQEVDAYLGEYDIDEDAKTELYSRAAGAKNGCFRLLDRTLSNIFRLMKNNTDKKITYKTIERASAIMML